MKKMSREAKKIMMERFGKDTVIALATIEKEVPYVRYVNAYYENGAFYIITYAIRGIFLANLFRFKRLAVRNKEICHAAGVFRVRWATT